MRRLGECNTTDHNDALDHLVDERKRRRKWHTFETTSKRKAEEECAGLMTAMKQGNYVEPTKQTVAEFLEEWLTLVKALGRAADLRAVCGDMPQGLAPLIGAVILAKLKTDRIHAAFTEALTRSLTASRRTAKSSSPFPR